MDRPPHVCIVSCQHVPDDFRVTHKVGMSMRQAGYRVTWVGPQRPRSGSDHGMEFRYYPVGKGRIGRLLHHRKALRVAGAVEDVDVYYAVEPDSARVAVRLGRRNGAKAVFDIHEVYHEVMLKRWARGPMRKLLGWLVHWGIVRICNRCDLVVAVSESVMELYRSTNAPQMIIHNFAPVSFGEGPPATVLAPDRQGITIMHGNATLSRGTREALQAAAEVRSRLSRPVRVVMFELTRDTVDVARQDLVNYAEEIDATDCMDLRPAVPMAEIPGVLRECDIGLLAYNREFGVLALPNRLLEYMSAGLPVIGPEYGVEVRRIVEAESCGLLVDCEDVHATADAVVQLCQDPGAAKNMGLRGREAFRTRYNWQAEVQPLLDQIRQWCSERKP